MGYLFLWLVFGAIAGMIGGSKGSGCFCFILGVLFGPFGILFAIFTSGNRVKCLACQKMIDPKATLCPYCRTNQLEAFGG